MAKMTLIVPFCRVKGSGMQVDQHRFEGETKLWIRISI
jgi:hypothetical protein